VVIMRTGSGEATVEHGRTGLLASDLDEFRAQLADLVQDKRRCLSMGEVARHYVARHHSLEVRLGRLESLLKEHRES
jgi:glycosyltransferase involved in cell wall biosynthesis